jgi:alpha-glucosidase
MFVQVFPDWFANNTQSWWTEALKNWSTISGVDFSGIWLDMNEIASFCNGSWYVCILFLRTAVLNSFGSGSGADLNNTYSGHILPGDPDNLVTEYPEG